MNGVRGPVGGPDDLVPFGAAKICREGPDCTVVTYGGALTKALRAADVLAGSSISAEAIDLCTLAPLDIGTITCSARRTGDVVVVDEAPKFAGPSAEIATAIGETASILTPWSGTSRNPLGDP
jgi:pyruvate dehydrogenase E1 component beta subunit